jgi:hypothetical protein
VPSRSSAEQRAFANPPLTQLHDPLQDKVAAKSKTPLKPNNKIIAPVAVRPAVLPGPRLLRTRTSCKQGRIGERALCVRGKAGLTECPVAGRRTAPRGLLWHANA